ncbi:MAG TPA: LysM domain-containing protein, partial [Phototrophicaceae bacterium]|nr:LysM domain-containing protein [Phototrophicaceae bacterium]
MGTDHNRWRWLPACLVILLFAAGCYQQTGVNPEPLSPLQPGPTNTLPPTETPFPTLEPTATLPEIVETEEPFQPQALPTETPFFEQPTADFFVPTDSAFIEQPTTDFFAPNPTISGGFGDVVVIPTESAFIAQLPTQDTSGLLQQDPLLQQPIDPVFQTATAIIAGATATEAANLTATAASLGFGIPTYTPTPTATLFGQLPTPTTFVSGNCVHVVVAGENLFRIALNYNTDLNTIATYNNILNPTVIMVGQQINIPNCAGGTVVTNNPVPVTSG